MKFFGLKQGETKPFLVTPWKSEVCNHEGELIRKCIDVNNLGKLVDQTINSRLNVKWGPDYRIEVPMPSAGQQALAEKKMTEEVETKTEAEKRGLSNNTAAEEHALPAPFSMTSPAASAPEADLVPSFAETSVNRTHRLSPSTIPKEALATSCKK